MYEQNENPWNDPQDSQSQQEMYHRNPEPGNASNGLAVAALICSVLSIVSVCCLYGAFVFGGLAIIFALLSRGARKKTYGAAHTALLIGTAGVLDVYKRQTVSIHLKILFTLRNLMIFD